MQAARQWQEKDRERRESSKIGAPSESSIEGYKREIVRLLKGADTPGKLWMHAAETTSRGTWTRRRAAIKHSIRGMVNWTLERFEHSQHGGSVTSSGLSRELERLAFWLTVADQEPTGTPFLPKKRKTKARGLTRLPNDWQQTLVKRMPKYCEAVAIAAITGCRPAELRLGIKVEAKGKHLVLRISGAKVTKKSGQEWRELAWSLPSESSLVSLLARAAEVAGGSKMVQVSSALTFSTAIRDAGRMEWPNQKPELTAYSLRHAAASEFKNAWGDVDQVSKALGHCASDTKGSYGRARLSRGGVVPDTVDAARPVRSKMRPNRERAEDASRPPTPFG